jgi:hypothetical protein
VAACKVWAAALEHAGTPRGATAKGTYMSRHAPEVQRVDFIAGEVHALLCFALAVSTAFSDRDLLCHQFEKTSQVGLAKLETSLVGDKTVAGFQDVCGRILGALQG